MFKQWKSLCNIQILKGTRPERIQCFVYARLLGIVLLTNICGYAASYAWHNYKKEASLHKVISWVLRKARLQDAVNTPETFLADLEAATLRLCKQSRKRKTTLELIQDGIGYLDTLAEKYIPTEDNCRCPIDNISNNSGLLN